MSGKIKGIGTLIIFLVFLSGCHSLKIPSSYRPDLAQVGSGVKGSWVTIRLQPATAGDLKSEITGELIGFEADTLFLLTKDSMARVQKAIIEKAELFIFKKPIMKYVGLTVLFLIPAAIGIISVPGEPFFVFTYAPLITGFASILFEVIFAKDRLRYPKPNAIEDFRPFSRFPQGIPASVNVSGMKADWKQD